MRRIRLLTLIRRLLTVILAYVVERRFAHAGALAPLVDALLGQIAHLRLQVAHHCVET